MKYNFENDLDALLQLNTIRDNLIEDLINRKKILNPKVKNNGSKLQYIDYKDLDNWDLNGGRVLYGTSLLIDKLIHMIHRGQIPNIKPMMKRIFENRVKIFHKPSHYNRTNRTNVGKGHFRCDSTSAYTLTEKELEQVKELLKDFV